MVEGISLMDALVMLLGLGLINEAFNLARDHADTQPPPRRKDVIYFDDFEPGVPYKRRYEDRHTEVFIEILPTKSPMGGDTPTYIVKTEVVLTGEVPPAEVLFWLDGVEWPLSNDGKIFPLGNGRKASDYFALVEGTTDPEMQQSPMLQRISFKGDPSV